MRLLALITILGCACVAQAHDTWVETNTNVIRSGDATYIDLKLGNHGNSHRDFKLASKIGLEKITLHTIDPAGKSHDIKGDLVDTGYAPKEGYWSAKFVPSRSGTYAVSHTLDTLHVSTRAIKSGKTYFAVTEENGEIRAEGSHYSKPLGHPIEFVPQTDPVCYVGPGQPIRVQLLFKGQPLADAVVTFIPRGQELAEGFDPKYERKTDASGMAEFVPASGNRYLVVTHHAAPEETGTDYERTVYSATLTVFVPEKPWTPKPVH